MPHSAHADNGTNRLRLSVGPALRRIAFRQWERTSFPLRFRIFFEPVVLPPRESPCAMTHSTSPLPFAKVFFRTFGYTMLLFVAYPGIVAFPAARQAMLWDRLDTAAMLLDLVAVPFFLALVLWLADRVLKGGLFRMGKPLLPFLYAVALMQLVPQHLLRALHLDKFGIWFPYLCMAAAGAFLSVLACGKRWNALLGRLAAFLPVFAIMFPLYAVQFLCFPPFSVHRTLDAKPPAPAPVRHPNVLVFSFDSIEFGDCVAPDGSWRKDLPAMRSFQDGAVRFDAALSGGPHTLASVPKFLFQSPAGVWPPDGSAPAVDGWDDSMLGADPLALTNGLFHLAKSSGYRTAAVTSYLPLGQLAAPLLDEALDIPYSRYLPPTSFFSRCLDHLVGLVDYVRPRLDAFARSGGRFPWPPHLLAIRHHAGVVRSQLDAIHGHIARLPPTGEFFYAHLVGMHRPLLFLENGTVSETAATPESQFRFTDSAFGALMDDLRARGRFDSAWIVFTSDHGYPLPGAEPDELRHVPFVVKPPHWSSPVVCHAPVRQWDMAPFFRAIFEGLSPDRCLELLAPDGAISRLPDGTSGS